MTNAELTPHVLLERYGANLAQTFLLDLLESVSDGKAKQEVQQAVDDLMDLIATDEKNLFTSPQQELPHHTQTLPPVFERDCVQVWLFDDALVSYNRLAGFFHGYRKRRDRTFRLPKTELSRYRDIIQNPHKLLDITQGSTC